MPWCPRCSTALSEHEIATEGYVETTHLALTVAFPLLDRPGEALLAWTTRPGRCRPMSLRPCIRNSRIVHVETMDEERARSDRTDKRPKDSASHNFWLAKGALERQKSKPILIPGGA